MSAKIVLKSHPQFVRINPCNMATGTNEPHLESLRALAEKQNLIRLTIDQLRAQNGAKMGAKSAACDGYDVMEAAVRAKYGKDIPINTQWLVIWELLHSNLWANEVKVERIMAPKTHHPCAHFAFPNAEIVTPEEGAEDHVNLVMGLSAYDHTDAIKAQHMNLHAISDTIAVAIKRLVVGSNSALILPIPGLSEYTLVALVAFLSNRFTHVYLGRPFAQSITDLSFHLICRGFTGANEGIQAALRHIANNTPVYKNSLLYGAQKPQFENPLRWYRIDGAFVEHLRHKINAFLATSNFIVDWMGKGDVDQIDHSSALVRWQMNNNLLEKHAFKS